MMRLMRTPLAVGVVGGLLLAQAAWAQDCDPVVLGSVEFDEDPGGVASDGRFIFSASGEAGVRVVDAQNPSDPVLVATFNTPGNAADLVLADGVLYVTDGATGLIVLDVSDPLNPAPMGAFGFPGQGSVDMIGIALDGSVAYMIDAIEGLKVLDVSDPSSPQLIGQDPDVADTQLRASKIAVDNGIACVAYVRFHPLADPGVRLLNVMNPQAPVPVGWLDIPGEPSGLALGGPVMFVASFLDASVSSYNVLDASSPLLMDSVVLDSVVDLTGEGTELYAQTRVDGLAVLDVENPASMAQVGLSPTPDNSRCVAVEGGWAITGDGGIDIPFDRVAGVVISDVSSCQTPGECAADLTGDGELDVFDVFAFLEGFNAGDPIADFNGDGVLDVFDVFAFLGDFNAGCALPL